MAFVHVSVQARREKLSGILQRFEALTRLTGNQDLQQTLTDLRTRIYDPFLFVIVGEVKAGKSSFINALLDTGGREICKVAPQPMTDTIQQITYGETEVDEMISPFLRRIALPIEALREIAIVDTPGTNTIVAHHQEVTERFVPAADLIIFVFESKNPYRQSAWEFFDFIHVQWQRKIIFVMQQKDLMPPADLAINIEGVKKQAQSKGIAEPHIFAVSAKEELEGRFDASGFSAMRDYIRTHVTGGRAPALKLANCIGTAEQIANRIEVGVVARRKQFASDFDFRNDIRATLDQQEQRSQKEVHLLLENILAAYDKHTQNTANQLHEGLNFPSLMRRSIGSIFGSSDSPKNWLEGLRLDLEAQLNKDLPNRLQQSVIALSESIQQMAKLVDLKIRNSATAIKNETEIFSDIADRRALVLKDLQDTFAKFLTREESFTDEQMFAGQGKIAPNIATGSGVAIIGVVLAALTQGSVFDITGGLLTGVGLLFTGLTVTLGRKRMLDGYRIEIEKGRQKLESEVTDKLHTYIRQIKSRIDSNFTAFDHLLDTETKAVSHLEDELAHNRAALQALRVELEGVG